MKRMPTLAAAAVIALATMTACGSSDKATSSATSAASAATSSAMSAASSATDTSSASPSSSGSGGSASVPAGFHMITAPTQHVTFAVPDSWVVPSGKMLQIPAVAEAVKGSDVMAMSTKPKNNFSANVNVIKPADNDPRLASKDEVTQQLAKIGGKVTGYEPIHTQLGDGLKITYSMTGSAPHQAIALEVPNGHDEFMAITVSASTQQEAEDAAKVIADTVKAA